MSETPIIDDQNKKNETLKDDKDFLKMAGKGALALGLAVGVGLGGVGITESIKAESAHAAEEAEKAAEQAKLEALDANLNATFPSESVIGEFTIPENGTLQQGVEGVLGKTISSDDYDTFLRSANNQGTVQPGATYSVVKADVDGNSSNGEEVFVVKPAQVHHGVATELPTPDTH